jgi:SAM-dependent methyltransferase
MSNEAGLQIEQELDIRNLRKGLLRYTRKAYALLPQKERPRVLEIGCGRGEVTLELARLTSGHILGIDVDDAAFGELRSTIEGKGLSARVRIERNNLFDVSLPDHSFDLIWEEGVLHILDPARSIPICSRLLKPGGFLVSCEIIGWIDDNLKFFAASGFKLSERLLWPNRVWWTDYYAPLEKRIMSLRQKHGDSRDPGILSRYESEVRMVKTNPEEFDCGHFLFLKPD